MTRSRCQRTLHRKDPEPCLCQGFQVSKGALKNLTAHRRLPKIQTVKCNCISVVTAIGGQGSGVEARRGGGGAGEVYRFKTFFQKAVWLQRFTVTEALSSVSYLVQDGDLKGIWKLSRTNF